MVHDPCASAAESRTAGRNLTMVEASDIDEDSAVAKRYICTHLLRVEIQERTLGNLHKDGDSPATGVESW